MKRSFFLMPVLWVLCFSLCGCQSKVTQDNFAKIQNDMTMEQVEKILGRGSKMGDGSGVGAQFGVDVGGGLGGGGVGGTRRGQDAYVWESDRGTITIYFREGKVVNKTSKGL